MIFVIVTMVLVLVTTVLGAGGVISPWWAVLAALLMIYAGLRRSERHWMPARERSASYDDLVDAETRALAAEEELIVERAQAQNHVRALLRSPKVSESDRVRDRDAALEWLNAG